MIENLKKSSIKIAKGMFAIFSIKIVVFFIASLTQSCQTDDGITVREMESKKFISSVKKSKTALNLISINLLSKSNASAKSAGSETYYLTYTDEPDVTPEEMGITEVETLGDIFLIKNNYNLKFLKEVSEEDYVAAYELPIEPIMEALDPATQAAKNYLYSIGLNEEDIVEVLEGEDEAALIPIIMEVTRSMAVANNASEHLDLYNLIVQNAYATKDARECFMDATGIAAGVALVSAMTAAVVDRALVKTLIKQAVKKIGGRALGGIGLALMAIDFTLCVSGAYQD